MNKFYKNKSLLIAIIVIVAAGGFIASNAKADISFKELVAEKVAAILGEQLAEDLGLGEAMFGASGTRFPHGISADSTSPSTGEVRGTTFTATGDVTVGDDLEVTGDDLGLGGVDIKTVTGSCTDATTTPIAILNPFAATSTITFFQVNFVGATSTFDVDMGVSTTAYRDGAGDALIDGLEIATSSSVSIVNGDTNAGTNSKANVLIDPAEYVTAKFTPRDATLESSLYDIGNTFTCTYSAIFVK